MKVLFFAAVFALNDSIPVMDSLPPIDSLYLSVERYYQRELLAELAEYQESKKGEWLKYLPSVGVNYALVQTNGGALNTRPRPTLSYSSVKLYQARRERNLKEAKMRSIRAKNALVLSQEKQNLLELYKNYYLNARKLKTKSELLLIERQLFEMKEMKYEKGMIFPDEYLAARKVYLIAKANFESDLYLLQQLKLEILSRARMI
ncbi:MAG: TolC family protein [Bacteroidota bacterium]